MMTQSQEVHRLHALPWQPYYNFSGSVRLTLIGWFPRTTTALLLLSDIHLLDVNQI
jgi:hypothetical protein